MPAAPVFLEHPSSLAHDTGTHPERADRIAAITRVLERERYYGFERVRSPIAERGQLTAVHADRYVSSIEAVARHGGGALDLDTVMSERSFEAALHASGGAIKLVDVLLDGTAPAGFSAHRPPGHHALSDRAMGFCLFNNIAIAAQHALASRGLERVLVLDWDVHHGNGTNDIFHSSDQVLFISIHQWPLYPGTGSASDTGSGQGEGYTVNLPVPVGSDDALYASLVEHVARPLALEWGPQLVLVSAGYDAHRDDPLGGCNLTEEGFAAVTRSVRRLADELGAPVGCVLEGGYSLTALASSVAATLDALVSPLTSEAAVPEAPLAREARARLARWWPGISV